MFFWCHFGEICKLRTECYVGLTDCIMLSTKAATTNKKVMPPSTAANRLGVHQDHHDDRRKNGNASKAGSDGTVGNVSKVGSGETDSMVIMGGSSGLLGMVDTVSVVAVGCRSFTGVTIGRSRNSSVPADVGRADGREEAPSGTLRKP
jgi:hypothetical protein